MSRSDRTHESHLPVVLQLEKDFEKYYKVYFAISASIRGKLESSLFGREPQEDAAIELLDLIDQGMKDLHQNCYQKIGVDFIVLNQMKSAIEKNMRKLNEELKKLGQWAKYSGPYNLDENIDYLQRYFDDYHRLNVNDHFSQLSQLADVIRRLDSARSERVDIVDRANERAQRANEMVLQGDQLVDQLIKASGVSEELYLDYKAQAEDKESLKVTDDKSIVKQLNDFGLDTSAIVESHRAIVAAQHDAKKCLQLAVEEFKSDSKKMHESAESVLQKKGQVLEAADNLPAYVTQLNMVNARSDYEKAVKGINEACENVNQCGLVIERANQKLQEFNQSLMVRKREVVDKLENFEKLKASHQAKLELMTTKLNLLREIEKLDKFCRQFDDTSDKNALAQQIMISKIKIKEYIDTLGHDVVDHVNVNEMSGRMFDLANQVIAKADKILSPDQKFASQVVLENTDFAKSELDKRNDLLDGIINKFTECRERVKKSNVLFGKDEKMQAIDQLIGFLGNHRYRTEESVNTIIAQMRNKDDFKTAMRHRSLFNLFSAGKKSQTQVTIESYLNEVLSASKCNQPVEQRKAPSPDTDKPKPRQRHRAK